MANDIAASGSQARTPLTRAQFFAERTPQNGWEPPPVDKLYDDIGNELAGDFELIGDDGRTRGYLTILPRPAVVEPEPEVAPAAVVEPAAEPSATTAEPTPAPATQAESESGTQSNPESNPAAPFDVQPPALEVPAPAADPVTESPIVAEPEPSAPVAETPDASTPPADSAPPKASPKRGPYA